MFARHIIIMTAVIVAMATAARVRGETLAVMLEKGMYQEQTAGNLDGAIKIYREIVDQQKESATLAAQAQFRIGECYLKQGKIDEATAAFKAVKQRFPDQKDLIAKAETRLVSVRKNLSEAQVAKIVDQAVTSISTRAEGDPAVTAALETLECLSPEVVARQLARHLDAPEQTMRRSAIYILWKGPLTDIQAAVPRLLALCDHKEEFTRGMTALVLGERKVAAGYDKVAQMAQKDASGYARRCAVYALGLYGDPKARELLMEAKADKDPLVASNAEAALKMLRPATQPARPSEMRERRIEKPAAGFKAGDASTPEGGAATFMKALASKDRAAMDKRSFVKMPDNEWSRMQAEPAEELAKFLKAVEDAQIEAVFEYGDLAGVVSKYAFPPGVGRSPYSLRYMGMDGGSWKNLGEDRTSNLDAARTTFKAKKERMLDKLESLTKPEGGNGTGRSAATQPTMSDIMARNQADAKARELVDEETRMKTADFDRQFAAYFRIDSAYASAQTAQQRAEIIQRWALEAQGDDFEARNRAIAALGNVRSKEAVPLLLTIARQDVRNNRPRWMAVRGLGRIGDARAVPALIDLIDHGNTNVRVYARLGLAQITGQYLGDNKEEWRSWYQGMKSGDMKKGK